MIQIINLMTKMAIDSFRVSCVCAFIIEFYKWNGFSVSNLKRTKKQKYINDIMHIFKKDWHCAIDTGTNFILFYDDGACVDTLS